MERITSMIQCTVRTHILLTAAIVLSASVATGQNSVDPTRVEIRKLDSTLKTDSLVAELSAFSVVRDLCVSPNGERVAFSAVKQGDTSQQFRIFEGRIDATEFTDYGPGTRPVSAPAAGRILVTRTIPEPGVWLIDGRSKQTTLIDRAGALACWSLNGVVIVYSRPIKGFPNLIRYSLIEETFNPVLNPADVESLGITSIHAVQCSPDGAALLVLTETESEFPIFLVRWQEGGKPIKLLACRSAMTTFTATLDRDLVVCSSASDSEPLRLFKGRLAREQSVTLDVIDLPTMSDRYSPCYAREANSVFYLSSD